MSEHITIDGEVMEIHPLADLFPMLPDDELAELAEDIKENGLRQPIVLDHDGRVVDGRNRLRACAIAGVEPQFQRLNGEDIAAFIVSQNINRRHLTKAQRAMSVAMIYPEPGKGGRGRENSLLNKEFSGSRLSQARTVLRFGKEDMAPAVISGAMPLNEAYTEACRRRDAAGSKENQIAELRRIAPDLADMVEEERLSLGEARAAYDRRRAEAEAAERNKRETLLRVAEHACRNVSSWASSEFMKDAKARMADPDFRRQMLEKLKFERVQDIKKGAESLVKFMEDAGL